MCVNCVTTLDAAAFAGSGAVAAASAGYRRLVDVLMGRSRTERRRQVRNDTAEFLRSLGHDPDLLLATAPAPAHDQDRVPVGA